MNHKKITRILSFIIFGFFLLSGYLVVSNLLHELSHKQDYKGLVLEDEICILKWGDGIASYTFKAKNEDWESVQQIKQWTEFKAYFIDVIVLIIFSLSVYVVIRKE